MRTSSRAGLPTSRGFALALLGFHLLAAAAGCLNPRPEELPSNTSAPGAIADQPRPAGEEDLSVPSGAPASSPEPSPADMGPSTPSLPPARRRPTPPDAGAGAAPPDGGAGASVSSDAGVPVGG